MSNSFLSEIESRPQLPDFSKGEDFLEQVRAGLRLRRRRRVLAASAAAPVSAVLLFILSFSAIQRQIDKELWDQFLLSKMEEVVDSPELDDFTWDLHLEYLLQEGDLDLLLEEILNNFEEGEERLLAINL